MRVRQRVYLSVSSETMPPERITADLCLTPDKTSARGSKSLGPPPLPRHHLWALFSGLPDTARLDDQLTSLLARMAPAFEALRAMVLGGDAQVSVQVVRYFEPGPEDSDVIEARDAKLHAGLEILRGQHPLLGFHLEAEQLARLGSLGLSIDFDEYGDEHE